MMVIGACFYRWLLLPLVVLAVHLLLGQVSLIKTTAARLMNNAGHSTTSSALIEPQRPSPPELFIYIPSWMEGMSSWMISLSEVLVLAKELNATLVEPCIINGRLRGGKSIGARGASTIRLSQVLDMERMRDYHDRIVSYEDYIQATTLTTANDLSSSPIPVFRMCLHHFSPVRNCGGAPHVYGAKKIPALDKALESARTSTTVLEIQQYSRSGFRKSDWVNDRQAAMVKNKHLRLSSDNFESVAQLLERMGIGRSQPYSVIHWRAELPHIDYLACADKLIEARDAMRQGNRNQTQHPFVLMSSLNSNHDYMWKGAKILAENTSADQALAKLSSQGFHKLDQVVDYANLTDPVMLAVYDLVLALKAKDFATCAKGCRDDSVCSACNWRGQFAGLAVSIRRDMANKSSIPCWPSLT